MDMESIRAERGLPPLASVQRSWTVELTTDQEDAWARRIRPYNTIARLEANVDAGMRFALDHPAWVLRSRVQTFADFFSPVSYFVRHASVGRYGGPLGRRTILQILVPFATATTVCVILLGILGLFTGLVGRAQLWLIGGTVGYFTATALLISHSRFRLPIEPLLIVMASGLLTGSWRTASGPRRASALLASAVILFFWWLNGPMALSIIAMAIGVES